jgi:vanillate O-demethylase monooxygenase subunit
MAPGLTRVELRVAPPGKLGDAGVERGYILYHTHTPVDGTNHVWRWSLSTRVEHRSASNPEKTLNQHICEMFPAVVDQDLWALEKQQQMVDYPDDGYTEIHLRSDQALIRVRKLLAELEAKTAPGAAEKAAA